MNAPEGRIVLIAGEGALPINILDGDIETGVSIMRVEQELDSGAVFDAATTPILRKTVGGLHDEFSQIGAELLLKTISDFEKRENGAY